MLHPLRRVAARCFFPAAVLAAALSGCQTTPPPPPAPLVQPPVATHEFTLDDGQGVVGHLQVTRAHEADTLADIARRFNVGYDAIERANPKVDPWLPHEGTTIVLPTQFVLPDAPRSGVVINLAALRLYYYPPRKKGESQTVITHPIGIGQIGWSTPLGTTKIIRKRADPVWYPPMSVRREHAREGDVLPAKVAAGPDNPLGKYAFTLAWPSYLIHGTNKPYGVGLRVSHGCVRLYPEDIAQLFHDIPVGTKVTVVNQPQVYGFRDDTLYMQSFPALEDYPQKTAKKAAGKNRSKGKSATHFKTPTQYALEVRGDKPIAIDPTLVADLIAASNGIAVPISRPETTLAQVIAAAPRVENRLPRNATWDGVE